MSIAVDGDRAVVRSFEKALEDQADPPHPGRRGRPVHRPWPADQARPSRPMPGGLEGVEASHAARLLAAERPLLHGLLVPLTPARLGRARTGRTVRFELTPVDGDPEEGRS